MAKKMKKIDFYNEPEKEKDTKEDRRKYLIVGYVILLLIAGIILGINYIY